MLAHINDVFSDAGINIAAQYLQTGAQLGYVATDIEAELDATYLERLRTITGTLRCRILTA